MATKSKVQVTPESLTEIRNKIREIDEIRLNPSLSQEEKEILELSAVSLRDAERVATSALQKKFVSDMGEAVKKLKQQSSSIRSKISAMNKVPKALDRVESVINGVASVMKEIARWSFCFAFLVMVLASCSVLTKSQVKMALDFATYADTISTTPQTIFTNLEKVRLERSLLYSASLSSPEAHLEEQISLSKQIQNDAGQIQKAQSYLKALSSYSEALKSLTSANRYQQSGTEARGIGRGVDTVLHYTNQTGLVNDHITTGFAKLSGRYLGVILKGIMRIRQAKMVKELVTEGDSLVLQCVDSLVTIMKSTEVTAVLENEQSALNDDYKVFLTSASATDDFMLLSLTADRTYHQCYVKLRKAESVRKECVSALKSFAKAHTKMAGNFSKRSNKSTDELGDDIYEDIAELNRVSAQLVNLAK